MRDRSQTLVQQLRTNTAGNEHFADSLLSPSTVGRLRGAWAYFALIHVRSIQNEQEVKLLGAHPRTKRIHLVLKTEKRHRTIDIIVPLRDYTIYDKTNCEPPLKGVG